MSVLDLQGLETPESKAGAKVEVTGPSNLSVSACEPASVAASPAVKRAKQAQSAR